MQTREALIKVFTQPRSVFIALKGERTWVPAVVFMVALLAIHGVIASIGTQSPARVGGSINLQSPITYSQLNSTLAEPKTEAGELEQIDLEHSDDARSFDSSDRRVGSFILWLSVAIGSLPFVFGILCLISLMEAIYFRIVSALLNYSFTLGDWFVLSVWSRVPGITLSVVALIMGVLLLGRQPETEDLEILRLTKWMDLPEVFYSGSNWGIGVNFDHLEAHLIWIIALQAIGFSEWTGKSFGFSLGIAVVPTLILIAFTVITISIF
ncbi:MAG: hypothetical protein OXG25_01370 [Gammaproteobacteria bacterium]|nr:hypothetical protein [Gammaproteobacteria bacterium]